MSHRRITRSLRLRYIVGLSVIALLVTASFITMQRVVSEQKGFAALINLAGHQSGLTNRIAYFSNLLATTDDETDFDMAKAQVGRAINKMRSAQEIIRNGAPDKGIPKATNPNLEIIFTDPMVGLDRALENYLGQAEIIYESSPEEINTQSAAYLYLTTYGPHVLEPMLDAVVDEFENIGDRAIMRIESLELGIWLATIITLILEATLIFWPFEKNFKKSFRSLEESVEELSKTKERLLNAQDLASVGDWRLDVQTGGMTWSSQIYQICGISRDTFEATAKSAVSLIHPEDRFKVRKTVTKALRTQEVLNLENRVIRPDGREVSVNQRVQGRKRADGKHELIGTIQDITLLQSIEKEREQLVAAIEQTGEMIVITDPEGIISYVNPSFEKLTGYSKQEIKGESLQILKSDEQSAQYYDNMWKVISRGKNFCGRLIKKRKDGSPFTVDINVSPICGTNGRILNYVSVIRDISDQEKMEEQLRQVQKMESIGRLTGGVAHDFNNILGVISGYAELAKENVTRDSIIYADLEEILDATRRSANIVRQLLTFSRQQAIAPTVLDINNTISGMLKMLRRLIGEDIELVWTPGPDLATIKIDPTQVDQVITNLCINSRGAITGTGTIMISTDMIVIDNSNAHLFPDGYPGRFIRLWVSDDGCGIDHDHLDKIFEPFFTTKKAGHGTGLGLATVYGIVKQNNGFIQVKSSIDEGSTFIIAFPVCEEETVPGREPGPEKMRRGNGQTILLVEDDRQILRLTETMLTQLNYRVLVAEKPSQAIDIAHARASEIDLLLTDVVMPEMNGKELAHEIIGSNPIMRHIYMSGYTYDAIADRNILTEEDNFISKPFSMITMSQKLHQVFSEGPESLAN